MDIKTDPPAKKPTLKTIAQLAGLAVPTVSRALGGAEDISLQTRARVRQIADEIGYVPNRAGVRLRTGRTNVISLVLCTEHEMMNHTAKLISSVASTLRETPFHLIITPYFGDEDPMKPIRHIVETGSADAVIFNQIKPEDPRVAYLMEKGFPFVTHGRTRWADQHPYYDFDNGAFARIAVETLARRGRRHVTLVAPPLDQFYASDMVEGAREAARAQGVALDVLKGATSDDAADRIEQAVRQHIADGALVDGVVCGSLNSCLSVIAVVESMGRVIGDDVDVFSKEATPFLRRIRSNILTISEDVEKAGTFMAQAAIQRIRSPDQPYLQELETPGES